MRVAVYTSFTFSYLGKARVLAESLKKFHPDWDMVALLTDKVPDNFSFDVEKEFFDYVIWGEDLDIPNVSEWISEHNIVEACTAVKGPTLEKLATSGKYDYVMYLDPDVAVFSSLQPLIEMFSDEVEVLLTPHQLSQEEHDDHIAIIDNELSSTKHGVYNLGFVCVASKGAGLKFANWWSERLKKYCRDDIPNGMFTDQKWCDLVPAYFDNVKIVRDPGYNVASWNISQRKIEFDDLGNILVNGSKLKFFHFTKLGPIGRKMTERYAGDNYQVYELWKWYEREINRNTPKIKFDWHYDKR